MRFVASNVEEKLEELNDASYEGEKLDFPILHFPCRKLYIIVIQSLAMLDKVSIDIYPKYILPSATFDASLGLKPTDQFPAWNLADYIVKIIRNSISSIDTPSIDAKVSNKFQSDLSKSMRRLGKTVEKLSDKNFAQLGAKEVAQIEDMLNIAHTSVGAVFCMWHIRHNIVGVPDEEGKTVKDFLRPIMLHLPPALDSAVPDVFESIPKSMRTEVKDIIDEATKSYGAEISPELRAAAALAHSTRITAGNDLRALITYNSDADDWPSSRDDAYVVVLAKIIVDYLLFENYGTDILYENLIAMSVLEETIGVREPRNSCMRAYMQALQNAVSTTLQSSHSISKIEERIRLLQQAMVAMMRLPYDDLQKLGIGAYTNIVSSLMTADGNINLEETYPKLATLLGINVDTAKKYMSQLSDAR